MERKFFLAMGLCIAIIAVPLFYFVVMPYFAPVETVNGVVLDVLFEDDPISPLDTNQWFTRVIVSDVQSVIWILQTDGHVPFAIGETYTFEVRMWATGSYSGPPVNEMTNVYPIADYSPRITPALPLTPISPLFIVFIIVVLGIVIVPWLLRYRRRTGSWPWSRL